VGDNTRHPIILEKVAEGRVKGGKVYQTKQFVIEDIQRRSSVQFCTLGNEEPHVICDGKIAELRWGTFEAIKQGLWVEIIIGTLIWAWSRRREAPGWQLLLF
jgi:hypothetical protein